MSRRAITAIAIVAVVITISSFLFIGVPDLNQLHFIHQPDVVVISSSAPGRPPMRIVLAPSKKTQPPHGADDPKSFFFGEHSPDYVPVENRQFTGQPFTNPPTQEPTLPPVPRPACRDGVRLSGEDNGGENVAVVFVEVEMARDKGHTTDKTLQTILDAGDSIVTDSIKNCGQSKLAQGMHWDAATATCVPIHGWSSPLEPFEVSPDELSCTSDGSNRNRNNSAGDESWMHFPFRDTFSSGDEVQRALFDKKAGDNNNQLPPILKQRYGNFIFHSSWLFRAWKPWQPRPVPSVNNSTSSSVQFRSRHDPDLENLFVVENFCISPFAGLSGFEPANSSYNGLDETRGALHNEDGFRDFLENVRPLRRAPPKFFDERLVIFVPLSAMPRTDIGLAQHRFLILMGILKLVNKQQQRQEQQQQSEQQLKPLIVFVFTQNERATASDFSRSTDAIGLFLRVLDLPWAVVTSSRLWRPQNEDEDPKLSGEAAMARVKQLKTHLAKISRVGLQAWKKMHEFEREERIAKFKKTNSNNVDDPLDEDELVDDDAETVLRDLAFFEAEADQSAVDAGAALAALGGGGGVDEGGGGAAILYEQQFKQRIAKLEKEDAQPVVWRTIGDSLQHQQLASNNYWRKIYDLTAHKFTTQRMVHRRENTVCFKRAVAWQNCFDCALEDETIGNAAGAELESYSFGIWRSVLSARQSALLDEFNALIRRCIGLQNQQQQQQPHRQPRVFLDLPTDDPMFVEIESSYPQHRLRLFSLFLSQLNQTLQQRGIFDGTNAFIVHDSSRLQRRSGSRSRYLRDLMSLPVIFVTTNSYSVAQASLLQPGSVVVQLAMPHSHDTLSFYRAGWHTAFSEPRGVSHWFVQLDSAEEGDPNRLRKPKQEGRHEFMVSPQYLARVIEEAVCRWRSINGIVNNSNNTNKKKNGVDDYVSPLREATPIQPFLRLRQRRQEEQQNDAQEEDKICRFQHRRRLVLKRDRRVVSSEAITALFAAWFPSLRISYCAARHMADQLLFNVGRRSRIEFALFASHAPVFWSQLLTALFEARDSNNGGDEASSSTVPVKPMSSLNDAATSTKSECKQQLKPVVCLERKINDNTRDSVCLFMVDFGRNADEDDGKCGLSKHRPSRCRRCEIGPWITF